MRYQLIILIGLIAVVSDIDAQWTKVFTGSVEERTSIGVYPDGAIIVAGVNFLSYSEDGGANWEFFPLDVFQNVRNLSVIGDSTVYMITTENILWKTTNRCTTMNYYAVGFPGIIPLYAIDFPSLDTGYIAGGEKTVFKSVDGGITWDTILHEATGGLFYDIHFFNNNHGITCDSEGAFRITYDGGENWVSVPSPFSNPINDIEFITDSIGYASTTSGEVCKTSDQGENWVSLFPGGISTNAVCFANEQEGLIVSDLGYYYYTIDSGHTWAYDFSSVEFGEEVLDIQFAEGYYYASCTNGDIFKIDDLYIPVSIFSQKPNDFQVIPNPANDFVRVLSDEHCDFTKINIFDSYGHIVISQLIASNDLISIDYLPCGLYFCELLDKNGVSSTITPLTISR